MSVDPSPTDPTAAAASDWGGISLVLKIPRQALQFGDLCLDAGSRQANALGLVHSDGAREINLAAGERSLAATAARLLPGR